MYEVEAARIQECAGRIAELREALNVERTKAEIADLEKAMSDPGFWDNPEAAQQTNQKLKSLRTAVVVPDEVCQEIEDAETLIAMAQEEGDDSMGEEIASLAGAVADKLGLLEIESLFADPRDSRNVILSIHPGAGGTESCDWAEMLYRMIMRFCERRGYTTDVIDYQPGDEASLLSGLDDHDRVLLKVRWDFLVDAE